MGEEEREQIPHPSQLSPRLSTAYDSQGDNQKPDVTEDKTKTQEKSFIPRLKCDPTTETG